MLLVASALGAAPAQAQSFRYSLAAQQEYSLKRGFKLCFEDNSPQLPHKLETLRLVMAVADGTTWRFPEIKTAWQWDRDYQVKVVIGEQETQWWLDKQRLGASPGGYAPARALSTVTAGLDWKTSQATNYLIRQTALRLSTSKNQSRRFAFAKPEDRPSALFVLDPQTPLEAPWKTAQGETITIEASFHLERRPDPRTLAPFVDRFGQSRHADWPGKIHNDQEFERATNEEKRRQAAWGLPQGYDAYGGYRGATGWGEKATGFYRTLRRNGFWWLVTPDGNPCFYVGVDTVIGSFEKTGVTGREFLFEGLPPEQGAYAAAWSGDPDAKAFGFTTANLIRKYGKDWEGAAWREAEIRLKTWGFSGVGKWSGIPEPIRVPAQPVLRRAGVPTLGRMPDIFDPQIRAAFRALLENKIAPHKNNPFVLGWSLNNEHDDIVLKSDIEGILRKPATIPAKRALVAHALQHLYGGDAVKLAAAWNLPSADGVSAAMQQSLEAATVLRPPAADIEALRRYFADQYYGFVYKTVKEIDPNHLYFGFWILPGWWENEEDWRLMARHCDVIGYDYYGFEFTDARLDRLMRESDKPVFCGEFSYPSWYGGKRGYGIFGTATATLSDAESGRRYADWLSAAARNPYCVGVHWFQYRDQPVTGRGTTGTGLILDEHYAFGLVDITDRPKWEMITPMRAANLQAIGTRLHTTQNALEKVTGP